MNHERIREIAREVGLLTHNPENKETKLDKFADLLVKDCAEHASTFVSRNDHPRPSQIYDYITQKMGVSEEKWEKFTDWPEL